MTKSVPDHLLSVVIPNYNYARFIADAMVSVSRQDQQPIELIVVDDGSTDNSLEVIEKTLPLLSNLYATDVIALDQNVGKLGAMNRAMDHIRGEYSIILDADDFLLPHYASRCIDELLTARRRDPRIGFVYTDCTLVGEQGQRLERGKSTRFDAQLLETFSFVPEPAVVLTRAMVDAAPFDESIRKGTKHHKWRRIVANGWHGTHLSEPLFCYRMHQNNLSGIGKRVTTEVNNGHQGERILSGYWPTAIRKSAGA